MANRNKSAGNAWELENVEDLAEALGLRKYAPGQEGEAEIASARAFDRALDNLGVDIWFKDFPLNVQSKNTSKGVNYHKLITEMPDNGVRVVFHKRTEKKKKNFRCVGKYAILTYEDFLTILKLANNVGVAEELERRQFRDSKVGGA